MPRDWIHTQLRRRGITDERVLAAMRRVPRELFVPPEARHRAYDDDALALSHGQTISQPFIVALIAQALELRGEERVLDVGTGSGYQAAVLADLAREVVGVERLPELAFDGIAVAAAAERVPKALVEQLAPRGILVVPVGEELLAVTREQTRVLAKARFVPLVTGFRDEQAEITGPS